MGEREIMENEIARLLLEINAVSLSPHKPFIWASGLKSPIYCDNRLTLSYPAVRQKIADGLSELIKHYYPAVDVIAGTATAGIPHAAWVSEKLKLPMIYVRGSAKSHGKSNQIEGVIHAGQKVVIIEDLISTGGSAISCANTLKKQQCEVLGIAAIFDYQLPQAKANFATHKLSYHTLSHYPALLEIALTQKVISAHEHQLLNKWNQAPENWQ